MNSVLEAYPMPQNVGCRLVETLVATREPHWGEKRSGDTVLDTVIRRVFQNSPRRRLAIIIVNSLKPYHIDLCTVEQNESITEPDALSPPSSNIMSNAAEVERAGAAHPVWGLLTQNPGVGQGMAKEEAREAVGTCRGPEKASAFACASNLVEKCGYARLRGTVSEGLVSSGLIKNGLRMCGF